MRYKVIEDSMSCLYDLQLHFISIFVGLAVWQTKGNVFPNGSLEPRPWLLGPHRNVFPGGSSWSADISDVFITASMWFMSASQFSSISN